MQIKFLLTIFLVLLFSNNNLSQQNKFFKKILSNRISESNGYFVSLDAQSIDYSGKVIITNGQLLLFLNRTNIHKGKLYGKYVLNLLSNKRALKLKKANFLNKSYILANGITFIPITKNNQIEEVAKKGCKNFIEFYFNEIDGGYEFNKSNNKYSVINQLFLWQVPTFINDISGTLVISAKDKYWVDNCKKHY